MKGDLYRARGGVRASVLSKGPIVGEKNSPPAFDVVPVVHQFFEFQKLTSLYRLWYYCLLRYDDTLLFFHPDI